MSGGPRGREGKEADLTPSPHALRWHLYFETRQCNYHQENIRSVLTRLPVTTRSESGRITSHSRCILALSTNSSWAAGLQNRMEASKGVSLAIVSFGEGPGSCLLSWEARLCEAWAGQREERATTETRMSDNQGHTNRIFLFT